MSEERGDAFFIPIEPVTIKIDLRKTAEELAKLAVDGKGGTFWVGTALFASPEPRQSRVDMIERALELGWKPTFKK